MVRVPVTGLEDQEAMTVATKLKNRKQKAVTDESITSLEELCRRIFVANPYKAKPYPGRKQQEDKENRFELMTEGIEVDDYEGSWQFRNAPLRIRRAIRIPYCYIDADVGLEVKDYLLIGYEGRGPG